METNKIHFTFVLQYYNTIYQFIDRILTFIDDYFELVLEKSYVFNSEKFQENGSNELTLVEIIPYFLKYDEIKQFNFSDFEKKEDLKRSVEDYVLSKRDIMNDILNKTIIIKITHEI
jgi:hypothetical protein